jgi:hypothetical protein
MRRRRNLSLLPLRHVLRLATDDEVVAGVNDKRVGFAFNRRLAVALLGVLWMDGRKKVSRERGGKEKEESAPSTRLAPERLRRRF